jgi:hypothetical protein
MPTGLRIFRGYPDSCHVSLSGISVDRYIVAQKAMKFASRSEIGGVAQGMRLPGRSVYTLRNPDEPREARDAAR